MPSGNPSMNHNGNQVKMFNMYLVVAHYSITYHGLEDPYMMWNVCEMYLIMWHKDMALLFLFLMDTPMNFQRKMLRTGTCSRVTVHFTGDMLIQSKKDEFLANKKDKQRFFNQRTREYIRCVGQCQTGCWCADSANNCSICTYQTYYLSGWWHRFASSSASCWHRCKQYFPVSWEYTDIQNWKGMVHTTVQGLVSICCLCKQSLVVKLQVTSLDWAKEL